MLCVVPSAYVTKSVWLTASAVSFQSRLVELVSPISPSFGGALVAPPANGIRQSRLQVVGRTPSAGAESGRVGADVHRVARPIRPSANAHQRLASAKSPAR